MKTRLLLLMLLAGSGCCRRMVPGLREVTVRDTVLIRPAVQVDTVLTMRPADTVRLYRERLRVQVVRQQDTLRVAAECRPDTVRLPLVRVVQAPAPIAPAMWPYLLVGAVLMGLLLRALRW